MPLPGQPQGAAVWGAGRETWGERGVKGPAARSEWAQEGNRESGDSLDWFTPVKGESETREREITDRERQWGPYMWGSLNMGIPSSDNVLLRWHHACIWYEKIMHDPTNQSKTVHDVPGGACKGTIDRRACLGGICRGRPNNVAAMAATGQRQSFRQHGDAGPGDEKLNAMRRGQIPGSHMTCAIIKGTRSN